MSGIVLQISLLGFRISSPALGSQRLLQSPVLIHLGLQVLLGHPGQDVGEVGGEEAGVDLRVLRVESVEMLAEVGHDLRVDLHTRRVRWRT